MLPMPRSLPEMSAARSCVASPRGLRPPSRRLYSKARHENARCAGGCLTVTAWVRRVPDRIGQKIHAIDETTGAETPVAPYQHRNIARGGFGSMSWPQSSGEFRLGDFQVQSGETIRDARLVWKAHGTLSPERDNVVLYPCSYGAKHEDLEWLIGPDGILDPTRWFIVIPNMFSNGVSSGAADTPDYPKLVTSWDSVQAQRRMLSGQFGIERLHAVYGF